MPKTKTDKTLFFTASWCAPCRAVKRLLAKEPALAERIEIVDVDENEKRANEHRVKAIPTFIRPDGERHLGAMTKKELRAFLGLEG